METPHTVVPVAPIEKYDPSEGLIRRDLEWIALYAGNRDAAEAILPELNQLAVIGSIPLRQIKDKEVKSLAFQARVRFLVELGVEPDIINKLTTSVNQKAYIVPVSTFIESQRILTFEGINPVSLYSRQPRFLQYSPDEWHSRLTALARVESEEVRMAIKKHPEGLLSRALDPANYDAVKELREEYGVDLLSVQAVRVGGLGHIEFAEVKSRISKLILMGIAPAAINRAPSMLATPFDSLETRLANIRKMGVDPIVAVNSAPTIISLSIANLEAKFSTISSLGLDITLVLQHHPKVLTLNEANIVKKYHLVNKMLHVLGWQGSAVELINANPEILSYSSGRLFTLGHILAGFTHESRQSITVSKINQYKRIAIGNFILALSDDQISTETPETDILAAAKRNANRNGGRFSNEKIAQLARVSARKNQLNATWGHIATRYLALTAEQ